MTAERGELEEHVIENCVRHVTKKLYLRYGLPNSFSQDDLYQEIRLYAYDVKRYLNPKQYKAKQIVYLIKSIHRRGFDRLYFGRCKTARIRQPTLVYSTEVFYVKPGKSPSRSLEETLDVKLRMNQVRATVEEIGSPREKQYFEDLYTHHLSYQEAADKYGLTDEAVRFVMRRLIIKLRKKLVREA